jgi:hypothetical protein
MPERRLLRRIARQELVPICSDMSVDDSNRTLISECDALVFLDSSLLGY